MLEPRTERSHLPDMIWFLGSMAQRCQQFLGDVVFKIFEETAAFVLVSTRTGVIEAEFVRNGDEWKVKISSEVGNYVEELEGDLEWSLNDCEYCTGGSILAARKLLWVVLGAAGQLEQAAAAGAFDRSRFYAPCGQEGDSDLEDVVELLGESWGANGDTTSDIESTESTDDT